LGKAEYDEIAKNYPEIKKVMKQISKNASEKMTELIIAGVIL
jgi:hypothetical protein